jgi:cytochrome d ubiquinol oxidase subunit II
MIGGGIDLIPIWTVILGTGVFLYVMLDGFDLGVGMLYAFVPEASRDLVMNSIAPIWDGNETWLILGGLGLLAVFPLAFAIIIPAVYFPVLLMLLGLVFRGVAFEFRFRQPRIRHLWARGFCAGSAVAAFSQGVVLGALIQGFKVNGRDFAGTSFDWLTPFSVLCGISLMSGYGLLGAGWLILKTEDDLQDWARRAGRICLAGVLAAIGIVSVWTPLMSPAIAQRWLSWPNIVWLAPVPLITLAIAIAEWRSLNRHSHAGPFAGAMGLFLMSYLGIGISLWPMLVPPHYTVWDAASAQSTQIFLLVGTMFLLPVIIMYTAWSYWVFRGKVRADIGYH